eukprot:TRINITY_DN1013_c0_g1_i2.p1 TRINITY_DN1013_c0_g1~~TRINITY_DN1013_c0_g1_i2.p1  ORF type:complete len:422 (-),score=58.65 TRINITY_DN1013_c0_g1_i2:177-1442(-)
MNELGSENVGREEKEKQSGDVKNKKDALDLSTISSACDQVIKEEVLKPNNSSCSQDKAPRTNQSERTNNHTTVTPPPSPHKIVKTNQSKQEEVVPTLTPGEVKSQSCPSSTNPSTEEKGPTVQKRLKLDPHCDISSSQDKSEDKLETTGDMKLWLNKSVRVLIEHLNRYGVCVVDNFMGDEKGSKLLQEIWRMQRQDCFMDGQVMSGGGQNEPNIRSDKITWTDGHSPVNCPNLRYCVKLLDSIVLTANRVKNNGELGKYRLNGRTRIMCACYPGGGTRYVKHVDNPNRDGRVLTAIYYLNKDWDSKEDGGSLKIYSQVNNGRVITIDPVFDRVIFFWSDARNPHEVLPSNRPRYAVTVWYLDEREKQEYERRSRVAFDPHQSIDYNTKTAENLPPKSADDTSRDHNLQQQQHGGNNNRVT